MKCWDNLVRHAKYIYHINLSRGVQGNLNGNYTANIVSMEYYPVITLLGWIFPSLKISKKCMISVELKGM